MKVDKKGNNTDKAIINNNIGQIISKYRNEKGLTQAQLAEIIHVSNKTISKWERGTSRPDLEVLRDIAKALDINVQIFLDGTIPKKKFNFRKQFIRCIKFIWNNIIKILILIFFIYLVLYFKANFNTIIVYDIKSDNKTILVKSGIFMQSKVQNVLFLHGIQLYNVDYEPVETKVILYTIFNGDKVILYESDELTESIMVEELYGYDEIFTERTIKALKKNLYLVIENVDEDNKKHKYENKLSLEKSFANINLLYLKHKKSINDEWNINNFNEIKLLNNGFVYNKKSNYFEKETKEIFLQFDLKNKILTISLENQNKVYKINYQYNFVTYIYSNENKINNYYKYYFKSQRLDCYKGKCDDFLEQSEYALSVLKSIK